MAMQKIGSIFLAAGIVLIVTSFGLETDWWKLDATNVDLEYGLLKVKSSGGSTETLEDCFTGFGKLCDDPKTAGIVTLCLGSLAIILAGVVGILSFKGGDATTRYMLGGLIAVALVAVSGYVYYDGQDKALQESPTLLTCLPCESSPMIGFYIFAVAGVLFLIGSLMHLGCCGSK